MKNLPLCCPCELKQELLKVRSGYIKKKNDCEHSKYEGAFSEINSIPILISEKRTDTVCNIEPGKTYIERPFSKFNKLKNLIVGESEVTKSNCLVFLDHLYKTSKNPKVLVIGGGEKGSGTSALWAAKELEIHSVDIYASDSVDIVCDGHYLPLKSNYYNGVWIQAVLEHVVEPNVVVAEIYRVMKIDGIVYAETPFMQQVHEGAYDFTRYTLLGHRYLFKKFELISLGGIKGPELVFAWSARYFIWALTRSRGIGRISGLLIGLLMRPFSFFMSNESMYDSSSCVYFIGRKLAKHTLSHKDLIKLYKGQF